MTTPKEITAGILHCELRTGETLTYALHGNRAADLRRSHISRQTPDPNRPLLLSALDRLPIDRAEQPWSLRGLTALSANCDVARRTTRFPLRHRSGLDNKRGP